MSAATLCCAPQRSFLASDNVWPDPTALARHRAEREGVRAALAANRERRERLQRDLEQARDELGELFAAGGRVSLTVAEMASRAGVRRDSAYRFLARVGALPRRELRRQANAAGVPRAERRAFYDELERERKEWARPLTRPRPRPRPVKGVPMSKHRNSGRPAPRKPNPHPRDHGGDWGAVEREQRELAELYTAATTPPKTPENPNPIGIMEKPLLVSDWRATWRRQREAGKSRALVEAQLETLIAGTRGQWRWGSLSPAQHRALFAETWPAESER